MTDHEKAHDDLRAAMEALADRWAEVLRECKANDPRWILDQTVMTLDTAHAELRALLAPAPASETARGCGECCTCKHKRIAGCDHDDLTSAPTPPTIKDTHRPGDYGTTAADFERPGCGSSGNWTVPDAADLPTTVQADHANDGPCNECGQRYVAWWVDHAIWNRVMGGPEATEDPGGFLCPNCFLAKAGPVRGAWHLNLPTDPPAVQDEALAKHRREWADYLDRWSGSVGDEPPTVESITAALRSDSVPFGCLAAEVTP